MKKLLLLSMLCLAVLSCGKKEEVKEEVAEVSTTQSQDYGVPNPFEIVDTLDEAAKIAGFSLETPTEYADYNSLVIQAIADDMIEVIYFDAEKTHEGLRIRKANGTDDISGDYNEYKEVNVVKVGELEVTEKGNDGNISIATWTDGTYSYSINVDEALLNVDDISNLISNIK
jgi:hypothetical protein